MKAGGGAQELLHTLWSRAAYDKDRDKPQWMELQAFVDELVALELAIRRTYGRQAAPEIRASLRRLDAIRRRQAPLKRDPRRRPRK